MQDPEGYDKLKYWKNNRNVLADILIPNLLDKMEMKIRKKQEILDFGCGSGLTTSTYILPIAEDTDSKILGLDISEEMIQYASNKYSNERLKFICGNIMSDEFHMEESNFDIIFSYLVLHFIKNYKEAFKRFYGLLKPGGKCGLVVCITHNQFPSYKLLGQDPKWSKYMQGYEEFYPDWIDTHNPGEVGKIYIEKAIEEAGFNILELNLKDMEFTCESLKAHADFVLTLNPFIKAVPKDMREELDRSNLSYICNMYNITDTEEFHLRPYRDEFKVLVVVIEKPLN